MKVYIVFDVESWPWRVEEIFQSRKEAEAYAAAMEWSDGEVEEWEVK